MNLYLVYFTIIYGCALNSLDKNSSKNFNKFIFSFIIFALMFLCGLRGLIDRDHQNYINIYGYILQGTNYLVEPTFYLFTYISDWLTNGYELLFILYAFAALSVKFYIFRKYSILPVVSLLIYFSNYYFLHEMTQIRVGVSIGLAIIAVDCWIRNSKRTSGIIFLASFLFHYSSLIFLIVPFLSTNRIKNKELLSYSIIIVLSYTLYFFNFGLAKFFYYIPIGFVQEKFIAYNQKSELGVVAAVNVFSVMQIIKIGIVLLLHFFLPSRLKSEAFFNVMFRFYIYSTICWVLFFDIPAFAIRLAELFGFAEIFILPYLIFISREKVIGAILLTLICGFMFYINLYHNELLLPYAVFWE